VTAPSVETAPVVIRTTRNKSKAIKKNSKVVYFE
jgi:hypothetical protein